MTLKILMNSSTWEHNYCAYRRWDLCLAVTYISDDKATRQTMSKTQHFLSFSYLISQKSVGHQPCARAFHLVPCQAAYKYKLMTLHLCFPYIHIWSAIVLSKRAKVYKKKYQTRWNDLVFVGNYNIDYYVQYRGIDSFRLFLNSCAKFL